MVGSHVMTVRAADFHRIKIGFLANEGLHIYLNSADVHSLDPLCSEPA